MERRTDEQRNETPEKIEYAHQAGDAVVFVLIALAIAGTAAIGIAVYVSRRKKLPRGKRAEIADGE